MFEVLIFELVRLASQWVCSDPDGPGLTKELAPLCSTCVTMAQQPQFPLNHPFKPCALLMSASSFGSFQLMNTARTRTTHWIRPIRRQWISVFFFLFKKNKINYVTQEDSFRLALNHLLACSILSTLKVNFFFSPLSFCDGVTQLNVVDCDAGVRTLMCFVTSWDLSVLLALQLTGIFAHSRRPVPSRREPQTLLSVETNFSVIKRSLQRYHIKPKPHLTANYQQI